LETNFKKISSLSFLGPFEPILSAYCAEVLNSVVGGEWPLFCFAKWANTFLPHHS
jgi:hypothetical protein